MRALLLPGICILAQNPPTSPKPVICHVTVTDRSGHPVTSLPQSVFTVFEDGVKQTIASFQREDVPVSLGLLIDNSGSMRPKRESVERAALELVQDSNPGNQVFVVNFADSPYIDNPHGKPFISDIEEIKQALTRIDANGSTAFRDAVDFSINHLNSHPVKGQKVLVVITDGKDNASRRIRTTDELVRNARQSGVRIYCIGLCFQESQTKAAKRDLNALADATGGEAFYPKELSGVTIIARQVAMDIRTQYTISFVPSNIATGTFRRVRVTVQGSGFTVRTSDGY